MLFFPWNYNLQFNMECLKYKALKMTCVRGPLLPRKMEFFRNVGKNFHRDFEGTWYEKMETWKNKIFVVVKNTAIDKQPMMIGSLCHDHFQHKSFFLPLLVETIYTISTYKLTRNIPSNSKYIVDITNKPTKKTPQKCL